MPRPSARRGVADLTRGATVTEVDRQPTPAEPPASRPTTAKSTVAAAPPREPKEPPKILALVKRLPFTTFYVTITLALAIATGNTSQTARPAAWTPASHAIRRSNPRATVSP